MSSAILINPFPQVVHKVGLCIALHDILDVGESYVIPGDGASHTKGIPTLPHPHSIITTTLPLFALAQSGSGL